MIGTPGRLVLYHVSAAPPRHIFYFQSSERPLKAIFISRCLGGDAKSRLFKDLLVVGDFSDSQEILALEHGESARLRSPAHSSSFKCLGSDPERAVPSRFEGMGFGFKSGACAQLIPPRAETK